MRTSQPAEHQGRAAHGGQHDEECRQRQRVECYRPKPNGGAAGTSGGWPVTISMPNMEIADEPCLLVTTVKTHLAAVYRKLPASRRHDELLRGRELELI